MLYSIKNIKSDFPIFKKTKNNNSLIYLDNASTTQKPNIVINSQNNFYKNEYASVHRGNYSMSIDATIKMENIRYKISNFLNASSSKEIIFTKSTTESINLVANTWGRKFLNSGDNIIISEMEHHSNIVPWQILAKEKKIILRYIKLLPNGNLDISMLSSLIDDKTKLLSIIHLSNVLGTLNPIKYLIKYVKSNSNAVVLIDGAQSISHIKIDVKDLNCDFYVFSGHKLYAPTGIGVLYGKKELLDILPPWEGGGSMIKYVSLKKKTIFNDLPWKFEAGTPNIAGIIGLGAAIDYIKKININNIYTYEKKIIYYAIKNLKMISNLILYGNENKLGIISFNLGKHHSYDVGTFLNKYGISIRTGNHCAIPLMEYFNVSGMCRISIAMYNTIEDIDKLIIGLIKINKLLN